MPADQRLPAACPACGVILAKLATLDAEDSAPAPSVVQDDQDDGWKERMLAAIRYVPERVEPVAFWSRCVALAVFAIWGVRLISLDYRTGEMMNSFLHGPILVFHEAGHIVLSLFGEFVMVLGGSLMQLAMPAIMAGALLIRNRDPFGAALGTWLFAVSLLDLSPYVYDSLHPQLVLLGGHTGEEGGHDWIYLLSAMGLLKHAQGIGAFVHAVGAILIVLSIAWAGWILLKQKARLGSDAAMSSG
jgi:hypothetical protein